MNRLQSSSSSVLGACDQSGDRGIGLGGGMVEGAAAPPASQASTAPHRSAAAMTVARTGAPHDRGGRRRSGTSGAPPSVGAVGVLLIPSGAGADAVGDMPDGGLSVLMMPSPAGAAV